MRMPQNDSVGQTESSIVSDVTKDLTSEKSNNESNFDTTTNGNDLNSSVTQAEEYTNLNDKSSYTFGHKIGIVGIASIVLILLSGLGFGLWCHFRINK